MTDLHPTRMRRARLIAGVAFALLALATAACWGEPAPLPAPEAFGDHPLAAHEVRVQLIFGPEADLDLFVTDPMHEEVYFGNSPSRLGGTLDADRRCGDPAPRVETIRFSPAAAGRYRVSVDYPIRCEAPGMTAVPFRVIVDANGVRQEVEGTARFGGLEHVVLEFEARSG